ALRAAGIDDQGLGYAACKVKPVLLLGFHCFAHATGSMASGKVGGERKAGYARPVVACRPGAKPGMWGTSTLAGGLTCGALAPAVKRGWVEGWPPADSRRPCRIR